MMEKRRRGKKKKSFIQNLIELIVTGIITVCVLLVFSMFIQIGRVNGDSMLTTFYDGDTVLISKKFNDYKTNDVIVFSYDEDHEQFYEELYSGGGYIVNDNTNMLEEYHVKRIIGVPGDEITIKDGTLSVNGEEFTTTTIPVPDQEYVLSEGEYFVAGDNVDNSYDSRQHGPIDEEDIIGRVLTDK